VTQNKIPESKTISINFQIDGGYFGIQWHTVYVVTHFKQDV